MLAAIVWTSAVRYNLYLSFVVPFIAFFVFRGDWFERMWFSAAIPVVPIFYYVITNAGELGLAMMVPLGFFLPSWIGVAMGIVIYKILRLGKGSSEA